MGRAALEVFTVEQFLEPPEVKPTLEFVRGRVFQKDSTKTTHGVLQLKLGARILEYTQAHRPGSTYVELRCTFGGESIVPVESDFALGRFPKDKRSRRAEDVRLPPTWPSRSFPPDRSSRISPRG